MFMTRHRPRDPESLIGWPVARIQTRESEAEP
jgi:hypothetical protein